MRAITVRQPWAWAIMHGGKDVENRTRNIAGSYRGPLVIHAAKTGASFDSTHPTLWPFDARHVFGVALGVVDLVEVHNGDCIAIETYREGFEQRIEMCSPWAEGNRHHLILANPRPFPEPIPYKGALGLWNFPDELLPEEFR